MDTSHSADRHPDRKTPRAVLWLCGTAATNSAVAARVPRLGGAVGATTIAATVSATK